MSKLNPNAGEWCPSFTIPSLSEPTTQSTIDDSVQQNTTTNETLPVHTESDIDTNSMDTTINTRIMYTREYLLQFQPLCDRLLCHFPDPVRPRHLNTKLGTSVNDRIMYPVSTLMQFQPLYTMLPHDFVWTETLLPLSITYGKSNGSNKNQVKQKDKGLNRHRMVNTPSYDRSLVCYFNPCEYAAAMNEIEDTEENTISSQMKVEQTTVDPIEEGITAKRRLATILENVSPDTIPTILEEFSTINISCTHTLEVIIASLFDRAIAVPDLCETYAQLCSRIAERTPEFKNGAKTMNFRRILLTRCYEALIEEPEVIMNGDTGKNEGHPHHSWRRMCMLNNVCLIGDLFRRQLLTENIMHVCVAMMLDDSDKKVSDEQHYVEILVAACRLLLLVGDLLDGSSPASRRTMDEYIEVLRSACEQEALPREAKDLIHQMITCRSNGWISKTSSPTVHDTSLDKDTNHQDVKSLTTSDSVDTAQEKIEN